MALSVLGEVGGSHVDDASFVNISGRDKSVLDELSEPCGGFFVIFVVIVHRW